MGSVVMVMEDADGPHLLLLLRNFMSQVIVHHQSLSFSWHAPAPMSSSSPRSSSLSEDEKQDVSF